MTGVNAAEFGLKLRDIKPLVQAFRCGVASGMEAHAARTSGKIRIVTLCTTRPPSRIDVRTLD
jgi:Fe2+ transport system protein B